MSSEFDESAAREHYTNYAAKQGAEALGIPVGLGVADFIEFAVARDHGQHIYNAIERPAFERYETERKRALKKAHAVEEPKRRWLDAVYRERGL